MGLSGAGEEVSRDSRADGRGELSAAPGPGAAGSRGVPGLPPGLLSPMKRVADTRVSRSLAIGGGEGLARVGEGERATRGCGDRAGELRGPAVSASSPLCGSGVFFPHGTQGRFVQFSQFDSPHRVCWGVGGGGEVRKKKFKK